MGHYRIYDFIFGRNRRVAVSEDMRICLLTLEPNFIELENHKTSTVDRVDVVCYVPATQIAIWNFRN